MSTYEYSDERRNDPELREKTTQVIVARNAALILAAEKLKEAMDILNPVRAFVGDPIFERSVSATWRAYYQVSRDADFKNRPITETYVGNLAASELGEQIASMGNDFDRFLTR